MLPRKLRCYLVTNAYRQVRRTTRSDSGGRNKTKCERILILLVESGFIYCLFWVRVCDLKYDIQLKIFLQLSQLICFYRFDLNDDTMYLFDILGGLGDQLSVRPFLFSNIFSWPAHDCCRAFTQRSLSSSLASVARFPTRPMHPPMSTRDTREVTVTSYLLFSLEGTKQSRACIRPRAQLYSDWLPRLARHNR